MMRELEPFPPAKPRNLKPHRLRLTFFDGINIDGLSINSAHLSEDGAMAIVMVDASEDPTETLPQLLQLRPVDDSSKAIDLPLLNEPCHGEVGSKCQRPEADKQLARVNKLLANHKWVQFSYGFFGDQPNLSEPGCGNEKLDRHSRIPGFDIQYKIVDAWTGVHLRIVRDDGAVITDSDFQPHTLGESEECRIGTMPYINDLGFDLERRAMYINLNPCYTEGCPGGVRFLFFRLPPPLPNASDATPAPKR